MSDDYNRGFSGQAREGQTNEGEYQRGERDRAAGVGATGMGAMDLSGVRDASFQVGLEYVKNPAQYVRSGLKVLIAFTIVGGLIGAGVAFVAGPTIIPSVWGLAFGAAWVTSWFVCMIIWFQTLGAFIGSRKVTTLTFLYFLFTGFWFFYGIWHVVDGWGR